MNKPVLNRLFPLLLLLPSSVLYAAEASTTSSNRDPSSTVISENKSTSTPATNEESSSSSEDQTKNQSEAVDKQSDVDKNSEDTEIDEEAIAELLNESEDESDEQEVKPEKKKKEKSPWQPEIEFGYQSRKGNDDNQSLNVRVALTYISGKLRNSAEVKIYREDEDGEEEEREQSYELQSDYKLGPKTYLYGSFKGIDSKYSSYFRDYTASTGFGWQVTNTKKFKLEAEIGPGYRIQEPNTDEIDDDDPIFPDNVDEPIVRGNLTAHWQPLKTLSFEGQATLVAGDSNTRFDTEISMLNNITEDIALKISHNRQHLSRVPNNLEKTDSTLNINLLFRFR